MTFHASYTSTVGRDAAVPKPAEGLFARMIRLWIEHHQRMIDFGIDRR